jgi:hypothetical protein
MPDLDVVELSRLQFAVTAMYHFLFVPLTLGMVWLLVIMESVYVMTGNVIWKDMTRFWGKLFGINFALGVTTGITLEFQFGTNWAYYSHYVGDIFGAPLAIEGLMAFFLESTFIGLFFFGWDRLTKTQHLMVTTLMAVGTNLSALWILVANGWMQNPVGADFSWQTMRMEMTDFWAVVFNPDAQAKFVHTVSAGYVTGAMFVLAVSSWYLLKGRDIEFAKRSFRVASAFGLASVLSVIVWDESAIPWAAADQAGAGSHGDRARASRPEAHCRHRRSQPAQHLGSGNPLGDGPDRHALGEQADPRHPRDQGEEPRAHRQRHHRRGRSGNPAQEPRRPGGPADARAHPGRPRFRTAAEEVHGRRAPGHARDGRPRDARHRAQGDADVLELSRHGRAGFRDAAVRPELEHAQERLPRSALVAARRCADAAGSDRQRARPGGRARCQPGPLRRAAHALSVSTPASTACTPAGWLHRLPPCR